MFYPNTVSRSKKILELFLVESYFSWWKLQISLNIGVVIERISKEENSCLHSLKKEICFRCKSGLNRAILSHTHIAFTHKFIAIENGVTT